MGRATTVLLAANGKTTGEIDYVLQHGRHVIPVEVKASSGGAMKSLHAFMHTKQLRLAARLDTNPPFTQEVNVKTTTGEPVSYGLLSLPLYMAEALPVCIDRCFQEGTP